MGLEPVRGKALSDLLQDLHGKSLGNSMHRDPGGMGCAADTGAVAGACDSFRNIASAPRTCDQDVDSAIQVSATWTGANVGALRRASDRDGRNDSAEPSSDSIPVRWAVSKMTWISRSPGPAGNAPARISSRRRPASGLGWRRPGCRVPSSWRASPFAGSGPSSSTASAAAPRPGPPRSCRPAGQA